MIAPNPGVTASMKAPSPSLLTDPNAAAAAATNPMANSGDQADALKQGTNSAYGVSTNAQGNGEIYSVNTNVAQNPYLQGDISAINNQAATVQGQTAAQAATPSQSLVAQSATNSGLSQAQHMAMQQAAGGGPAAQAIQMQAQNATNQGLNAQLAMAGNMRGGNAGEALRQGELGQAQVTGQAANQAAQNSLASEQAGQQNLGSISGALQQNSQFNAGATNAANMQTQSLGNTTALANAAGQNTFTQNQDQQIQSLMAQGMSLEQAQQQSNIQMAEYATGSQADQEAAAQGHAISQQNADTSSATAAINGFSAGAQILQGAAGSDRRIKKEIEEDAEEGPSDFLDHLAAKEWDYKDPDQFGHGRHLGVMAQDLEKSAMGRGMVEERGDGVKMVNYGGARGMAAIVASLAHLNSKMKELEALGAKK